MLNGAPTLYCFHTSCAGVLEEANYKLRSALAKAQRGHQLEPWKPSPDDLRRQGEKAKVEALQARAAAAMAAILKRHEIGEREFRMTSPHTLDCLPAQDWLLLLELFSPSDVVWIGAVTESGQLKHKTNFRPAADWLRCKSAPGNFTCPSAFKNNVHSRSNENAIRRRFLVIESDTLQRVEMLAVIQWCRQFMRLRAVVDTGGKSLHGWFDYPEAPVLEELKLILPQLGCDRALFKTSQPCRLPGAWRAEKGKWQKLLWLDREGAQ